MIEVRSSPIWLSWQEWKESVLGCRVVKMDGRDAYHIPFNMDVLWSLQISSSTSCKGICCLVISLNEPFIAGLYLLVQPAHFYNHSWLPESAQWMATPASKHKLSEKFPPKQRNFKIYFHQYSPDFFMAWHELVNACNSLWMELFIFFFFPFWFCTLFWILITSQATYKTWGVILSFLLQGRWATMAKASSGEYFRRFSGLWGCPSVALLIVRIRIFLGDCPNVPMRYSEVLNSTNIVIRQPNK